MTLPGRVAAWGAVLVAASALLPAAARAQLPHLDPLPWYAPADSTARLALQVDLDRFFDPETEWTVNRALLTARLPAGRSAVWFLRMPYLSFDSDGYGALTRWPHVEGGERPDDWPGGDRLNAFGQLEVGVTGPAALPLLGPGRYALALGLPTGTNRAYPWSSTSLPLRVAVQRGVAFGSAARLWLGGGYLVHMNASGDQLDQSAFPNGWRLDAELAFGRGRGSSWDLFWTWEDRNTRLSQLVGIRCAWGWAADSRVGLRVARELADVENRPAQWYATVFWRFDSVAGGPAAAAK